jgi:uncharacterized protein
MPTKISSGAVRNLLAVAFFLAFSVAQAASFCPTKRAKWPEAEICAEPRLQRLDQALNEVYFLVRQSISDKSGLRSAQVRWLRQVRDKCESQECLTRVYGERLIEIRELHVAAQKPSETHLSNAEAKERCTSLAAIADSGRLTDLAIPGHEPWQSDENSAAAGWTVSPDEKAQLEARESGSFGEPSAVYKLRLTANDHPTRFGNFSTGGTCASGEVFNIQYLLESKGDDVGVDEVNDPNNEVRWAYWGGGDYPIFYRGHYFMITADYANQNRVNMISWIKPDGRRRPLCLLSAENTKLKVVSAKKPRLCSAVASKDIRPIEWKSIKKDLPFSDSSENYRVEFIERYGSYADEVSLLSIDLDGSGRKRNIGRFDYASSAGCGSTKVWLSVLSEDLGSVANDPLNGQLREGVDGSLELYKASGRYYIAAIPKYADSGVIDVARGKVRQICKFRHQTKTSITHFFDVEP